MQWQWASTWFLLRRHVPTFTALRPSPTAVAELETALAARDTQLAAAQEAQRSTIALMSTRGRSTMGEVRAGQMAGFVGDASLVVRR